MTKTEAAQLVAVLVAGYPSVAGKFTEANARVYESRLVELDFAATQQAVARLLDTSKFLPSVAEIREASIGIRSHAKRLARTRRLLGTAGVPELTSGQPDAGSSPSERVPPAELRRLIAGIGRRL